MLFPYGLTIFYGLSVIQVQDLQLLLAQYRGNGLFEVAQTIEDVLNAELFLHFLQGLKECIRLPPLKLKVNEVKSLLDVDSEVV